MTKATRHESVAHWRSGKTIEIPDYDDIILYWHSLAIYQRNTFSGSGYQQPLRDQAEGQGGCVRVALRRKEVLYISGNRHRGDADGGFNLLYLLHCFHV